MRQGTCTVCGASATALLYERLDRAGLPVQIAACRRCDALIVASPDGAPPGRPTTPAPADGAPALEAIAPWTSALSAAAGPGSVSVLASGDAATDAALRAAGHDVRSCAQLAQPGAVLLATPLDRMANALGTLRELAAALAPEGVVHGRAALLSDRRLDGAGAVFYTERTLRALAHSAGFAVRRLAWVHAEDAIEFALERQAVPVPDGWQQPGDSTARPPAPGPQAAPGTDKLARRILRRLRGRRAADPSGRAPRPAALARRPDDRFWWHRLPDAGYDPPIYASLAPPEWTLLEDWYRDTAARGLVEESNVPAMCLLQGLVMGNAIRALVQLGASGGYSLLLGGFLARRMGFEHAVLGVELDAGKAEYCRSWIRRAGLERHVRVQTGDSADPRHVAVAVDYFGMAPQLVFVDSSHAYAHTLRELDLWVPAVVPGGFVLLHDTSEFAAQYDVTRAGGVKRAFDEWVARHTSSVRAINICNSLASLGTPSVVYKDGCGLGILQTVA